MHLKGVPRKRYAFLCLKDAGCGALDWAAAQPLSRFALVLGAAQALAERFRAIKGTEFWGGLALPDRSVLGQCAAGQAKPATAQDLLHKQELPRLMQSALEAQIACKKACKKA